MISDDAQRDELERSSAISADVIRRAKLETITDARDAGKLTKRPPKAWTEHLPALGFPYRFPDDPNEIVGWSLKGRTPLEGADGPIKYVRPKGFSRPFLPPDLVDDGGTRLDDPKIPKLVTEGEKKALAACSAGFACIAIPGVQNWGRGKNSRPLNTNKILDPILERIARTGAEVFIGFDTDRSRNAWVHEAETRLAVAFTRAGARVYLLKLPADGPKGLDDFLAAYGPAALAALIDKARRGGPIQATADPSDALDELATATRFVAESGRDFAFCSVLGGWYAWDGRRWQRDEREEGRERVKRLAIELRKEASINNDDDLWRHARKMASDRGTGAVLNLARSSPIVTFSEEELNADPWLLNAQNGTIDLRTGAMRAHERADRITKLAPVHYDEHATAPLFATFLEEILPSPEVRAFVQRFFGYAATGLVREHVLPVFYGVGANGKSTLIEVAMTVLGSYAQPAPREIFMERQSEQHPTELASLFGARLVCASETKKDRRLDEAKVKAITGGDRISARYMRKDFFTFLPTHKAVLLTNHRPHVRGTDNGIWRRIALVPFDVQIPVARQDTTLKERLAAEGPGVLRWIVDGCLAWQRQGLAPPDAVRVATQGYRDEEDEVGAFLEERCVSVPAAKTKAKDLYAAYARWCEDQGRRCDTQKSFGDSLTIRGIERKKSDGIKWYLGLGLRSNSHADIDAPRGRPSLSLVKDEADYTEAREADRDDRDDPDHTSGSPLMCAQKAVIPDHGPDGPYRPWDPPSEDGGRF